MMRLRHAASSGSTTSTIIHNLSGGGMAEKASFTLKGMIRYLSSGNSRNQQMSSGGGGGGGGPSRFSSILRENPRLRTHAVSIFHGDYSDNHENDRQSTNKTAMSQGKHFTEQDEITKLLQQQEKARIKQKQRWLQQAKPHVRVTKIDSIGRSYGRGSRKTASARVWIQPGFGEVVVNRTSLINYFPREYDRDHLLAPFVATETCGLFDVRCHVQGGGKTGQAGAIRHGLARALQDYNPDLYRPPLKRLGYLTRDPRMVERKKVGKVKARKSPQWVRR